MPISNPTNGRRITCDIPQRKDRNMKEALSKRIRRKELLAKISTPKEAARSVQQGMKVGTGGATHAGYPRAFFLALADRIRMGEKLQIDLHTCSPLGQEVDGELAKLGAVRRRLSHQAQPPMAKAINDGKVLYADMGACAYATQVRYGFFGTMDLAVVEAVAITEEGFIVPSTTLSDIPSLVREARQVVVEINLTLPEELEGIHDIHVPENPPNRKVIPIVRPTSRVGTPYIEVDPNKILHIIGSDLKGSLPTRPPVDESSRQIAHHLIQFFEQEVREGRMPSNLFPFQAGLGGVAEAVLRELAKSHFRDLWIHSALLNDAVLDLIDGGKVVEASGAGLYLSEEGLNRFFTNLKRYKEVLVLRPLDISCSPEVIQRLGVIALNGAIEVDIYGHVNSTHIGGGRVLTGVAGSIEFARNSSISIFLTPSVTKGKDLSCIVPMVPHVDHTEHEVTLIVTEQGYADLRGLDPRERARVIIDRCAHPEFRPLLKEYFERAMSQMGGHEPQLLDDPFPFHRKLKETGKMK
jgi:succinyl-CoA:acetate CoA-transferase